MYLSRPSAIDLAPELAGPAGSPPGPDAAARAHRAPWLVRRVLRHMKCGRISVRLPSGRRIEHAGTMAGPAARVDIHRWRGLLRMLTRGDIGLAEGFIAGDWSSPDLTALIAMAAANVERLDAVIEGLAPVRLARRLGHLLRRNSVEGSRRNIAFHYDLGNDFYRLWLDRSMTYSSAIRLAPGQSLEAAQAERLDRIAQLLRVPTGGSVLEIGCGWGALAARLAVGGARVTGLTLSREQLAHARDHAAAQGVADRVGIALRDYRHETGRYDRVVSIEMIEAVGEAWWPAYFAQVRRNLAPGGRAVIQAITIRPDRFASYKRSPDFIQHYIFPGGMLMTPAMIGEHAGRAGLRVSHAETFGEGYAQTLAEWRRRFLAAREAVAGLGFDEGFCRTWEYYLSYCEAGFRIGTIDVGLYVLEPVA